MILASIIIPVRAAKIKDPRLGLKKTLIRAAVFNLVYLGLVMFVWHRV